MDFGGGKEIASSAAYHTCGCCGFWRRKEFADLEEAPGASQDADSPAALRIYADFFFGLFSSLPKRSAVASLRSPGRGTRIECATAQL